MKPVLILLCVWVLLLVASCDSPQEAKRKFADSIVYVKDARTGLCFAYATRGYKGFMATVPCDKVEGFLH